MFLLASTAYHGANNTNPLLYEYLILRSMIHRKSEIGCLTSTIKKMTHLLYRMQPNTSRYVASDPSREDVNQLNYIFAIPQILGVISDWPKCRLVDRSGVDSMVLTRASNAAVWSSATPTQCENCGFLVMQVCITQYYNVEMRTDILSRQQHVLFQP